MKHFDLITAIKNYYGKFENQFIEDIILKFILTIPETELENAFKKIINNIPRKDGYNNIDIAKLQTLFSNEKSGNESDALYWFDKLSKTGNSLDNVIISDNRAEQAILSFGGWMQFCQRDIENEHWHRKNFVDAFCKPVEKKLPQIIYGQSRNLKKQPLMFGDISICQDALTYSNPADKMLDVQFNKLEGMK